MLLLEHYLLLDSWLMLSWIVFEDIKSMIKLAPQPTISIVYITMKATINLELLTKVVLSIQAPMINYVYSVIKKNYVKSH